MAIHFHLIPRTDLTDLTPLCSERGVLYICADTEAERPNPAQCLEGDLCFTHDTDKLWKLAAGAWAEVGGGGGQAFPVGAVFLAVVSTNPATLLGYGTWAAFGAGRMLVGLDAADADFDTAEETGGAKTHTLTVAEMPAHTHTPSNGTAPPQEHFLD